jgi:hypothetical protein
MHSDHSTERPPIQEPPNRPSKPPVEEPGAPGDRGVPANDPPVIEPPNSPRRPPVEPPPEDPTGHRPEDATPVRSRRVNRLYAPHRSPSLFGSRVRQTAAIWLLAGAP